LKINEYTEDIISIFYKLMNFPKTVDAIYNLSLNKIFYDDKSYYDLIE
jgi:hypothetical protein